MYKKVFPSSKNEPKSERMTMMRQRRQALDNHDNMYRTAIGGKLSFFSSESQLHQRRRRLHPRYARIKSQLHPKKV
jgi:hypothetical protein